MPDTERFVSIVRWASSVIKETGYIEHDEYFKDRSEMLVRIEPAMMKDRFKMNATFRVTPVGSDRCRREFSGDVSIGVPLIGGKIEKFMVEQMQKGYETAAVVTREFVSRRNDKR